HPLHGRQSDRRARRRDGLLLTMRLLTMRPIPPEAAAATISLALHVAVLLALGGAVAVGPRQPPPSPPLYVDLLPAPPATAAPALPPRTTRASRPRPPAPPRRTPSARSPRRPSSSSASSPTTRRARGRCKSKDRSRSRW